MRCSVRRSHAPLVLVVAILLEPYRIRRIQAYLDPFADASGSGYQVIQSLFDSSPGGSRRVST